MVVFFITAEIILSINRELIGHLSGLLVCGASGPYSSLGIVFPYKKYFWWYMVVVLLSINYNYS
jgi:hypothetical protein